MLLLETAILLLSERVPIGYSSGVRQECQKLVHRFLAQDDWAKQHGPEVSPVELDTLSGRLVAWVRAQGYPVMDEPVPPYGMPKAENLGAWGPLKS
jgi:hypothetical protein